MNNNIEKYELQLLYISQIASIIFIIISLIAIFLTHHDIKVLKHEKTLITDEESYNISYFNRILIIIILLIFLYISDENRKIAKIKGKDIKPFNLQEIASVLTLIASLIILYSLKLSKKSPLAQALNPII